MIEREQVFNTSLIRVYLGFSYNSTLNLQFLYRPGSNYKVVQQCAVPNVLVLNVCSTIGIKKVC